MNEGDSEGKGRLIGAGRWSGWRWMKANGIDEGEWRWK